MKRLPIILFMSIIYIPLILWVGRKLTGCLFDTQLKGFAAEEQENYVLTGETYWDGSFQGHFTRKIETQMPLRGVFTKTYNTINFSLFGLGNRPIGKNGYIYEPAYLKTELVIGEEYDYSLPENVAKMQETIKHMVSVQKKLAKFDKQLYVYIAPSKVNVVPEMSPANYVAMGNKNGTSIVDLLRSELEKTDVPYRFCSDLAAKLQYPAFYSTGIHWSRPYEQLADQQIVWDLANVAGKKYRNLVLGQAKQSKTPFWRDTDVYDLLNVWNYPDIDYYEYEMSIDSFKDYDSLRLLLFGDSFAEGLRKDILENIPEAYINIINRNDFYWESNGNVSALKKDWNNFDWQRNLDISDVIAVEVVEPELIYHTYGFLEYLDNYLDHYVPNKAENYYMTNLDSSLTYWDVSFIKGLYSKESTLAWAKKDSHIYIQNEDIAKKGMEFSYVVPEQVFGNGKDCIPSVAIYVNRELVIEKLYDAPCQELIKIAPKDLKISEDGVYEIEIHCSEDFNPMQLGIGDDERDLAIQILYIGGAR